MIQFQNVTKKYGDHVVLNHVDLEVNGGEFMTIVGPSGAGKSTLLHALIGAAKLDEGTIMVDGYDVTSFKEDALQEYRQKVGMVFQDYKLLKDKTVYENVAFALEVCGWKEEDIKERVYEVLDLVGMLDHEGKFPRQLAGGEGQRTAIARAMVHRPRLFIADEPTGNLDPWNREGILDILNKINENGATVVLSTHNRELVDKIKRRVVVLNEGRIVADKENSGYEVDALLSEAVEKVQEAEMAGELMGRMAEAIGSEVGDIEITEILEY
jgi:cell division transport system ATP-binding protein